MKTWDEISKADKEKIKMFYTMTLANKMLYTTMILIMYVGAFLGITLIFLPSIYTFSAGMVILFIVLFVAFWIIRTLNIHEKKLKLVFDVNNIMEDIFEIADSDIKKVKKKWVKVK